MKILYLCRTHSQNTRVIRELEKVSKFIHNSEFPIDVNGLSIRGRSEMCLNKTLLHIKPNPREAMAICSDLRKNKNCSYFLNLLKKRDQVENPVLIDPDIFNEPLDAEELIQSCKDKKICPYFLSKFLLKEMKVIICNYQWIFNPFIRESFLKYIGKELDECILVIDECHNIIDVATEVNSMNLTPYSLRLCLKDLEIYNSPRSMQNFVNLLLNHLNKMKQSLNVEEKPIKAQKFLKKICTQLGYNDLQQFKVFINEIYEYSISIHEEKIANGNISRDFLGSFAEFWIKWIGTCNLDSYFFCYALKEKNEKKLISIEIVALDPREISIPILKSSYACLNLSGTVNPYVFNNLMGLNKSGKSYKPLIADSPFKKKNIKAIIIEGVSTRREDRNPSMFRKMVKKIEEVVACTPLNIGIFCASYKILKALLSFNLEKAVMRYNKKIFIEEPSLSASENSLMIEDFKSMAKGEDEGGVLLGVCGGRNSEGEDYPGGFMNSVIIAGFPYHLPTPRVNAKITYYDKVFEKQGWNFAYLYPAVQRANQASGRPIRKIDDKGAIIFMDERFKNKHNWISEWIRTEIEIVSDQDNAIYQTLYPFWNA